MKGELVQLVFVLFSAVLCAAAEELSPDCAGVGMPFLLALVMALAPRLRVVPGVMAAIGAGALEDALASLPPMTAICFFVIAALVARKRYFPSPFLIAVFPLFELWAGLCILGPKGDVFARMLVSLPLGAAAFGILFPAAGWLGRRVGLDG